MSIDSEAGFWCFPGYADVSSNAFVVSNLASHINRYNGTMLTATAENNRLYVRAKIECYQLDSYGNKTTRAAGYTFINGFMVGTLLSNLCVVI